MFRRRHAETSYRPPASSAWWADQASGEPPFDPRYPAGHHPADQHLAAHYPAGQHPAGQHPSAGSADQAPPLPASDPFGGWPVFGADGGDATDAVIGQPDPAAGWSVPAALGFPYGQPAGPRPPLAGLPAESPELAQAPDPASAPAAPIATNAAFPPAPGEHPEPDEWLPLLTHEEQRVQAELAQLRPGGMGEELEEDAAGWPAPPAQLGRPSTDRLARNGKRRATRTRKTPAPVRPLGGPSTGPANWHDPVQPPDPMAAAALAGAFAADYLSWDEANPMRRGEVLTQYLPSAVTGSVAAVALLGWSGKGRQRSEFTLPGAVSRDEEGRLIVDVRVRVTPYRPVGQSAEPASAPSDELEVAGVPSVAPAPTARGWKSLDSHWIRLAVPVVREHGRLVVDTWDEQCGDGSAQPGDPAQPDGEAVDADEWHDQPATQTTGGTVPPNATGAKAGGNRVTPNTTGAKATRAARGAGKGRPSAGGSR